MNKPFTFLFVIFTCFIMSVSEVEAKKKNRYYFEREGKAIWEVPTEEKVIALTFDDGPSPTFTPKILDLLKSYDVKATFFSVGYRMEKQPEIVKRQVEEGHEIANHTYSHPSFRRLSKAKIKEELNKTTETIYKFTGKTPKHFRPPEGYYNEKIINTANETGYTVVMWSWHLDSFDWRYPGVDYMVRKILSNATGGDIMLFHDFGGDRTTTIKALQQIIPVLKMRGYTFVTVTELLQYHPNYKYLENRN